MYKIPTERRKKLCRFPNLTELEANTLTNGCGSKGGWFNPPDYLFFASCNWHDFNYFLGGTKADRKKADDQFLGAMLMDAYQAPRYLRWWLKGAAYRYYWAVRAFGVKHFYDFAYNGVHHLTNDEQWERIEIAMEVSGAQPEEAYYD